MTDVTKAGIQTEVKRPARKRRSPLDFTAIDFETADYAPNSVCQVGLARVEGGVIVDEFCELIKPPGNFIRRDFSDDIHGIYPEHTANAPAFAESWQHWRHFVEGQILVAHNVQFDFGCLYTCLKEFCGIDFMCRTYCTMKTWAGAFKRKSLAACCAGNGIIMEHHHNALSDARACAELFLRAIKEGRKLKS
ncbi:MAG: 3'-5' exoribonuclease [Spirochaetaceae bacterium]|jgi:DNA polymerase-3 subunit epsilon|nr:3'-5' exoribonuclease [Spirochaetaceae bacterium]